MDECLVIGGGVIGLSLAYELARHELRVSVIDRGTPGREASWAGAGILPPANRDPAAHAIDRLHAQSCDLHATWAEALREETSIDTGFRRCGGIYLARTPGEIASLAGWSTTAAEQGIEANRLSIAELVEMEASLGELARRSAKLAAWHLPDEAQIRNPRHLAALQCACEHRGVRILANAEARELLLDGGRVDGVRTEQGILRAATYCLASGPWTRSLLERLGFATGIYPVRGQMLLFGCARPPLRRIVSEGPRYLVPRDDGHLLVGSTEEEVGFDKRTTRTMRDDLASFARGVVDELRGTPIVGSWAGLRPASFDGFPYLGFVPGLRNLLVAAGHFRSGLLLSPATAVQIGRLIRGLPPTIDLGPFRIGRG